MYTRRVIVAALVLGAVTFAGVAGADLIGDGTPRAQNTPGVTPSPGGHPLPTPAAPGS
jgi:hypothetical protein